MQQAKKKVLLHLPMPINSFSYDGTQGRVLGFLKYFRDRRESFSTDVVAGNKFGNPEWISEVKQEILKFVDNIFIYAGERNLYDFFYTRSKSFYYQKLLQQQLPVDSDYFAPPGYVKFVRSLISQRAYDFVWINNLDYAHLAAGLKSDLTHTLIDMHDITSRFRLVRKNIPYSKTLKFDYESNFTREVNLLNKFDTVFIDSQYEMAVMKPHFPPNKLYLIPTLIESFNNAANLVSYLHREFKYDLLFVGAANQPNREGLSFFFNSIFPKVVQVKPDIKFAIAGKLGLLLQIDESLAGNVECLGYVPNLSDLYLRSRIVICPLIGGAGTKFKLVEAMAYAMPIVTTEICASALSLIDGVNACITDDSDLYTNQILRLLKEPELAQKLSKEVAVTFERQHSSSAIYSKLDEVFGILPSQS